MERQRPVSLINSERLLEHDLNRRPLVNLQHRVLPLLALGLLLLCPVGALAVPINYDPLLPAPAPTLDAGWASDVITGAFVPSSDSPYAFVLTAPAVFTITDNFIYGDTYFVTDGGPLILTTLFFSHPGFVFDPSQNVALADPGYSKGSVLLGIGPHLLSVSGDGVGGIPAGFFTRLDSVPEPSTFVLGALGLATLVGLRLRCRQKAAV